MRADRRGGFAILAGLALVAGLSACANRGEPFKPARPGEEDSTLVEGNLSGTWTLENSPYYVTSSITVLSGRTLTIEPGVNVIFLKKGQNITVRGRLVAAGRTGSRIAFRPSSGGGTVPHAGDWGTIRFENSNGNGLGNQLSNVRILYAVNGVVAMNSDVTIDSAEIVNHLFTAVEVTESNLSLSNSTIANNGEYGIRLTDCEDPSFHVAIDHCNIGNNLYGGIWAINASVAVTRSDIKNNGTDSDPKGEDFNSGIHFEGTPGIEPPTFTRCNILNNEPFDIRNLMQDGLVVVADSTWWGTATAFNMDALSTPDPEVPPNRNNCTFNINVIWDAIDEYGSPLPSVTFCRWRDDPWPNFPTSGQAPGWGGVPSRAR